MKLVFNVFTGNLDYVASSPGDVGIVFPLAPNLGGTGIANAVGSTLTLGGATIVPAPGGTVALLAANNAFTGNNTSTRGTDSTNFFFGGGGNTPATGATYNVALGSSALAALTTGDYNVAIGADALISLTEGNQNFALGWRALATITTVGANVAVGVQALRYNVTGANNVAIGNSAMLGAPGRSQTETVAIGKEANSYGSANSVYIGTAAGAWISGYENVAIGHAAMFGSGGVATDSRYNVILGKSASYSIAGSSYYNTIIGYQAGYNMGAAVGYNIFLGANAGYRQTTPYAKFIVYGGGASLASAALEQQRSFLYGDMAAGGYLQLNIGTTTNNAIKSTLKLQSFVSTAATGGANGFGVGLPFYAETATDETYQQQGLVATYWVDATNASRKATLALSAYDTAERKGIEIRANGSTPDIVILGDTWWEGEGFGLPYGSCSSNDTDINWTQAAAVQNTWYDISDADMVDGQLNLVTHDGSGKLTVTLGGRYLINYGLVAEANAANTHLETAISVSGTESGFGISHAEAVTPNTERNFNGTAILDLAANATINLSIRTTDAGGPNLKVEMMDITLIMVGGT